MSCVPIYVHLGKFYKLNMKLFMLIISRKKDHAGIYLLYKLFAYLLLFNKPYALAEEKQDTYIWEEPAM